MRRIRALDSKVKAFARLYPDVAQSMVADAQQIVASSDNPPVTCGQPVGIKDWMQVGGLPMGGGSSLWNDFIAEDDCTLWRRLRSSGSLLVGHTHAFEPITAPPTRNPWNLEKNPGGSSAGSAVAVATGMVPLALGTETTQSLRQPASLCGISTFKPSYGMLSLFGVLAYIRSYDHPGVLGRSVQDCCIAVNAMLGRDLLDPTTFASTDPTKLPVSVVPSDRPFAGLRIGIPDDLGNPDAGVDAIWLGACRELEELGADLLTVRSELFSDNYASALQAEILYEHRGRGFYPDRKTEYGSPFRKFIEEIAARRISNLEYIAAQRERAEHRSRIEQLFQSQRLSAIFMPACEFEATEYGRGKLDTRYVTWSNLCGLPAVGFPGGLSPMTSMPVGLQFIGAFNDDARVAELALHYQTNFKHHLLRPTIAASAAEY